MPKIYVHDFKFDYYKVENALYEDDFYCSVYVYFNFSREQPADNWEDLEYLTISVATPFGLAKYLVKCIQQKLYPNIFFFPHILIVQTIDEDAIMEHIKSELQSIYGKTENELLLKALRKFDWESEEISEVYNRLFK